MGLADQGRKAGATAKATDGPENRSVQVAQPGKQRLTAGLGPAAGVYKHAFPDGPRGREALLLTDPAPESEVSPLCTTTKKARRAPPTRWPHSHSYTRSTQCNHLELKGLVENFIIILNRHLVPWMNLWCSQAWAVLENGFSKRWLRTIITQSLHIPSSLTPSALLEGAGVLSPSVWLQVQLQGNIMPWT